MSFMVARPDRRFRSDCQFAMLPGLTTFAGFSIAIGLVLGRRRLMTQPWQPAMFTAMAANFVPLLAPAKPESYDTQQFYNAARWRSSRR